MLHSDIDIQDDYWLDKLIELASQARCDILSVVAPLKNEKGLTSTALYNPEKKAITRRLTMYDVNKLPETFASQAVESLWQLAPETRLLVVNTGCMLVKLDRWCEKLYFHTKDYMLKVIDTETNDITYKAAMISEDWLFSIEAQALGVKVLATSAIQLQHIGKHAYPNHGTWGILQEDDFS